MTTANTTLKDDVLRSPQLTAAKELPLAEGLLDFYAQTGCCNDRMLVCDLLRRIEQDEPEALTLIPPATFVAVAKWLEDLRLAMFTQNSTLILGTGRNGPSSVWISGHCEFVLEWSAPSRRLSFYLHANYTSAVISEMINFTPVSQHVDGVSSDKAAGMLAFFQGRA